MSRPAGEPIPVHLVADSTKTPETPKGPRRTAVRYRTVTLSAGSPVQVVAGTEPYRKGMVVRATTNDVYLCESQAEALAVVNAQTGGGLDTAYLLPHIDTAPTSYESTEQVYAAAIAYPAVLSVIIISRET
jgi:hypothetical protein